jgi:shikimate kinase
VLIGMMGSGKSTVGKLLAEKTGWPRYDNDALLLDLFGVTAKQIVEARREEQKREAEYAALAYGLSQPAPCILDAAGGTITSEASRTALAAAIVVWLHASPEALYQRAIGGAHRPFIEVARNGCGRQRRNAGRCTRPWPILTSTRTVARRPMSPTR